MSKNRDDEEKGSGIPFKDDIEFLVKTRLFNPIIIALLVVFFHDNFSHIVSYIIAPDADSLKNLLENVKSFNSAIFSKETIFKVFLVATLLPLFKSLEQLYNTVIKRYQYSLSTNTLVAIKRYRDKVEKHQLHEEMSREIEKSKVELQNKEIELERIKKQLVDYRRFEDFAKVAQKLNISGNALPVLDVVIRELQDIEAEERPSTEKDPRKLKPAFKVTLTTIKNDPEKAAELVRRYDNATHGESKQVALNAIKELWQVKDENEIVPWIRNQPSRLIGLISEKIAS